jgi:MoxR-like ATPase
MDGRSMPDIDDVRSVANAVLRHRLVLNFQAEADNVPIEQIIEVPKN